jgi:hypothetical protein
VNSESAIYNGGLANNNKFFGSATAEVVSRAVTYGGWNTNRTYSVRSSYPWQFRGGSAESARTGLFTFRHAQGGENNDGNLTTSHRTILSGY